MMPGSQGDLVATGAYGTALAIKKALSGGTGLKIGGYIAKLPTTSAAKLLRSAIVASQQRN